MGQGNDSAHAELPFKAEPDIDQDGEDGCRHRRDSVPEQFLTDFGADEFGAPVFNRSAQSGLHRLHRFLLGGVTTFLALHTDQDVGGLAEFLQSDLAKA